MDAYFDTSLSDCRHLKKGKLLESDEELMLHMNKLEDGTECRVQSTEEKIIQSDGKIALEISASAFSKVESFL
jgi:hypothetical protein